MSDLLQSGNYPPDEHPEAQHPDADQLNAFAELALPEHEHLEMLAHLASCSDCREIIALSLPPLEDASRSSSAPLPRPWFVGWFEGWRLVWIAAPALAALVILTIHLKNSPLGKDESASSGQVADSHPPSPPLRASLPPEPSISKVPLALRAAPPRRISNAPKPSPEVEVGSGSDLPLNGRNFAALKAPPSAIGSIVAHDGMSGVSSGAGASPTTKPSGGTVGFLQQPARAAAVDAPAASQAAAGQIPPLPPSSPASAPAPASVSSADSAAVVVSAQNSVVPGVIFGKEVAQGAAVRKSGLVAAQAPLPSGRATLSQAANFHQRLAIDTHNQLFFSEDDGQHWKAVSALWKGRAIMVATIAPTLDRPRSMTLAVPEHFSAGAVVSTGSAEAVSSLGGSVTDATGAVISNATVVATDSRTALVRTVQTDASGRYQMKELPPGVYHLEARAPGFLKQSQTVALAPSQQARADMVLAVGASTQTVTVEASPAQLETLSRTMPDSLAKAKKPAGSRTPNKVPPLFIITTDTGDRWTSADGQTWKHE